ncbi:hypothetical protein MY10362_004877 [Beauveria mimosiformis]
MGFSKLALLAGAVGVAAHVAQSPLGSVDAVDMTSECRLPPAMDPYEDGLPHSSRLWGGRRALSLQVKRLQAIVRVPSVCYDDLGPIGRDERWKPFDELHRVIEGLYPAIYKRARVERINTYGLLYTIYGSDSDLKPILLMAHQDVVPVADGSTWTHDPFEGVYDGQYLWGRGAVDDKNSLTAIMSTLEAMLGSTYWRPRRTVLVAFGFDEECSGYLGAHHIAEVLTHRYGDDGLAVILDEGGFGIQTIGNVKYVLPSITEKGHVDVWFELDVFGGHSSVPPPHSGIGIMSEMVSVLEANPFKPVLTNKSPVYAHMACLAHYSPNEMPEITELVRQGNVSGIAEALDGMGGAESFKVRTSQAVDFIRGGQKMNALPEKITLGVNYRVTLDDGIPKVLHSIIRHIDPIVKKYNLTAHAFVDDEDYAQYAAKAEPISSKSDKMDARYEVKTGGRLVIKTADAFQPSNVSPMHGKVWDTFSGSAQHTLKFDGTVVPVGETMTGNTDTRHYQNLSRNIYRFTPTAPGAVKNIHTIDERVDMHEHMKMLPFYYDLIRNFDGAELEGDAGVAEDNEEL